MTDIMERLREIALKDRVDAYSGVREACEEAADEIDRLRACLKERDKLCAKLEAAAAEVGPSHSDIDAMAELAANEMFAAVAAERERCAQVAEKFDGDYSRCDEIAAAIRKLKD